MSKRLVGLLLPGVLLSAPLGSGAAEQGGSSAGTSGGGGQSTLVSQVLERGRTEGELRFDYTFFHKRDLPLSVRTEEGRREVSAEERTRSSVGSAYAGVGLGYGLQLTATLPYYFARNVSDDFDEEDDVLSGGGGSGKPGWADLTLGTAYQLVKARSSGFQLALGLDVKLDTAGTGSGSYGTGTTDWTPYLAVSLQLSPKTIPYAQYGITFRGEDDSDAHTFVLGAQVMVDKRSYFDLRGAATYNTSDGFDSFWDLSARLKGYIALTDHSYLTPSVGYLHETSADNNGSGPDRGTARGYQWGLGLYVYY